jgi:hypothetical protein
MFVLLDAKREEERQVILLSAMFSHKILLIRFRQAKGLATFTKVIVFCETPKNKTL